MSDNKNFQNASEHSDAQPGPIGNNDNVNLLQEIQAPVQDVSRTRSKSCP